jgi:hypothetical protein
MFHNPWQVKIYLGNPSGRQNSNWCPKPKKTSVKWPIFNGFQKTFAYIVCHTSIYKNPWSLTKKNPRWRPKSINRVWFKKPTFHKQVYNLEDTNSKRRHVFRGSHYTFALFLLVELFQYGGNFQDGVW